VFPIADYLDANGGSDANRELADRWGVDRYHRPADEWQPEFRAAWAAKEAGFDFLLGLSVANSTERPHWNPGDVFGNPPPAVP
jgi:hypothetical protein